MGGSDSGPPHRFREIRPCHLSYEFGALPRIGDGTVQIVKRSDTAKGFELMPRRWVVERTLAWIGSYRRLAKDWEKSIASALGKGLRRPHRQADTLQGQPQGPP